MHHSPAIQVKKLNAHYGSRQILFDIDLTVERGEIMVIMGGSGSGKSTLLRHLLGLRQPSSGFISLLDHNITDLDEMAWDKLRQDMGVAFQGGALFGSMTVGENVMLPLREHTQLEEQTMRIMSRMKLEVVNLAGLEGLMPSELSGGMVKRAALARAVVMDPKLLFCDEPSAGLDPVVAAELDELILALRAAMNISIVVVTHELASAFTIADRITVLDQGRIIISGTKEEVRACKNERVQDLLLRRPGKNSGGDEAYLERLIR